MKVDKKLKADFFTTKKHSLDSFKLGKSNSPASFQQLLSNFLPSNQFYSNKYAGSGVIFFLLNLV
jgi:hypothetical protein